MGWVEALAGKTVAVDTAPLIYFIEQRDPYLSVLKPFFLAVDRGEIQVVTSVITLLEVLVHPLRSGDEGLARRYNDILLSSPNIELASVTALTAQTAAELRSSRNLKTPDAVQLAVALEYNAAAFLTNDRDFGAVENLEVLRLIDLGMVQE